MAKIDHRISILTTRTTGTKKTVSRKQWCLATIAGLLLTLGVSACTNSRILISPVYNQLERRMLSGFKKMADFDQPQIEKFRRLLANFHYWHRRNELPKYADLLSTLSRHISTPGQTEYQDIKPGWNVPSSSLKTFVNATQLITQMTSFDRLQHLKKQP